VHDRAVDVAIVGGGPAGAAVAIQLALTGHEVVLFERWRLPRWRAAGVYTSPDTRRQLAKLGLSASQLEQLLRPIGGMTIETIGGAKCRLAYESDGCAAGVDRVRLERALLNRASAVGADVREGAVVTVVERDGPTTRLTVRSDGQEAQTWRPALVIGADGPGSIVARAFGAARRTRWLRRAGLTVHRADHDAATPGKPMDARMVVGPGWYCGIAPVPGDRVNVGLVLGERTFRSDLAAGQGSAEVVDRYVAALPGNTEAWRSAPATDEVMVSLPLAHRVGRRAGSGFLLVGDAAGFVDPISGEGLHRAFVSADLGASAVRAWLKGERGALEGYEQRIERGFGPKDLVSWLLQVFLSQPLLLDYAVRRLDSRALGRTFGRVLADLEPARRVLDPRYLAAVLRP
jgi:flavin-dependent dehydrogenase